ncbi:MULTISPECIES: hypothetical protein [Rhodococcus]|uniref:Uncharacterized protein n=1 Tax=Rhodococcus oxybenzonivorans TaxID=1990687 RepID=A0AAE5A8F1_9NOCA|nr:MULTISPECIES: hypothetical protein [Rhodococcus]MDV7246764.1 hypothetical protein [Rhodococcus oxybenzonivorans]MDV7267083.1 hypothetical protein [Rhodococcus oxybenzonivorans]MDV7278352.1 hypothetical protein [Rhodococcus oxybenzonivorans]MDV7337778.1 hypothetical protein [Rhodococcus oxybenzonivorans]MDV7346720.1 hypothetical protein [Rhodococcus oxybenzonivorans]
MFEQNESSDPSNRVVEWKDGRTPRPDSICTARKTNGEPCRKQRVTGATVCTTHGGRAPQVKEKARIRLEMAGDKLAKELLRIAIDDPDVSDAIKLAAIRDALGRIGITEKTALEVQVGPTKPFEAILTGMLEGGSRAESRAARGVPDSGLPGWLADELNVVDAEFVDEDEPARPLVRRDNPTPAPESASSGLLPLDEALTQLQATSPPPAPQARRRNKRQ